MYLTCSPRRHGLRGGGSSVLAAVVRSVCLLGGVDCGQCRLHRPGDDPGRRDGRQQAPVLDASSLLQTHVELPENEVPPGPAGLATDNRLQETVNLAVGRKVASLAVGREMANVAAGRGRKADPWVYSPIDAPAFGSQHVDVASWSKHFAKWDKVKRDDLDESELPRADQLILAKHQDESELPRADQQILAKHQVTTGKGFANTSAVRHQQEGQWSYEAQRLAWEAAGTFMPFKFGASQWEEGGHSMQQAMLLGDDPTLDREARPEPDRAMVQGWWQGLAAGLVIGGLIFLAVYNVNFWYRSSAASPPARLPYFDTIRFALETTVISLHLGILRVQPMWSAQLFFETFRMPSFIFISGLFGTSVKYQSISEMLCCTWGTAFLFYIINTIEDWFFRGPDAVVKYWVKIDFSEQVSELWFLLVLAYCRLFITPIFHFAGKAGLKAPVVLVLVKSFNFLLMCWLGTWRTTPIYGYYIWVHCLAFGPFFALGLAYTPKEWDALFRRRSFQAVSLIFILAWYLLILYEPFLNWNKAYCLPQLQKHLFETGGCDQHFDSRALAPGPTLHRFVMDWVFYALRAAISVAVVAVLYAACMFVEPLAPKVIEWTAGWGSRTLFAYVLHLHFVVVIQGWGRFPVILNEIGWWGGLVISLVSPWLINILLSCQGTEHLFKWLLRPVWIRDFLERYLLDCRPKPAGHDEGAKGPEKPPPKEEAAAPKEETPPAPGKEEAAAPKEACPKEERPK